MLAVRGSSHGHSPWILPHGCPRHYPNQDPQEGLFTPTHASLDPMHDNEGGVCEEEKTDPNCASQMQAC